MRLLTSLFAQINNFTNKNVDNKNMENKIAANKNTTNKNMAKVLATDQHNSISKQRGTITVFLCIVLSIVILLSGALSDAARLRFASAQLVRSNKLALISVLSNYNNLLKDEYGLFGVSVGLENVNDIYEEYLIKNLYSGNINTGAIFDYSINASNIQELGTLENIDILNDQLTQYMKYRAPYELTKNLVDKLTGMKKISKGAQLYDRKLKTSKKADEAGKLQLNLEKNNKLINQSKLSDTIKSYQNTLKEKHNTISTLNREISDLFQKLSQETEEKEKNDLIAEIDSLKDAIGEVNKEIQAAKSWVSSEIESFKNQNTRIIAEVNALQNKFTELNTIIEEELVYAQSSDSLPEIIEGYTSDLNSLKSMVSQDNSAGNLALYNKNIDLCNGAQTEISSELANLDSVVSSFANRAVINYEYYKPPQLQCQDQDNRAAAESASSEALSKNTDLTTIPDEEYRLLPSVCSTPERGSPVAGTGTDIDFSDGDFIQQDIEELASQQTTIESAAEALRDNIYITEYIMGTFKHDVPILDKQSEKSAYNLRSKDKSQRDGFFSQYEVEYIINGYKSESANVNMVKGKILMIRLISNILHIYTNSSKLARVRILAQALSIWSAGLCSLLIEALLVGAWAMLESVNDIDLLSKGKSVMFFKTSDDWVTDISGSVKSSAKEANTSNPLCFNYHDYLRIFLLLENEDNKSRRIQDLIQLNMRMSDEEFLIKDCVTLYKATCSVSVKNFFLSMPTYSTQKTQSYGRSPASSTLILGY